MVSSLKISKFALDHFYHYLNPGQHLKEDELLDLYRRLLKINADAKHPVQHKLLEPDVDVAELRERYGSMIVCLIKVEGLDSGFLLSPVLSMGDHWILHAGLVMINHNRGSNLMALAGTGTSIMAYEAFGTLYTTNISSTPSIIENYSLMTTDCWPTPKASVARPPKDYKEVAHTLVNCYVKKYFPNPEAVSFDDKRFVLRSESQKMGFNTDFRQLSRSSTFEFLNFCFCWLDYSKEEDLIQVGLIDSSIIRKMILWRSMRALESRKKSVLALVRDTALELASATRADRKKGI